MGVGVGDHSWGGKGFASLVLGWGGVEELGGGGGGGRWREVVIAGLWGWKREAGSARQGKRFSWEFWELDRLIPPDRQPHSCLAIWTSLITHKFGGIRERNP